METGDSFISNKVDFYNLNQSLLPTQITPSFLSDVIQQLFHHEYEQRVFEHVRLLLGIYDTNNMRLSPNDEYTMVIKDNINHVDGNVGLFKVNNSTWHYNLIDIGKSVSFEDNQILS